LKSRKFETDQKYRATPERVPCGRGVDEGLFKQGFYEGLCGVRREVEGRRGATRTKSMRKAPTDNEKKMAGADHIKENKGRHVIEKGFRKGPIKEADLRTLGEGKGGHSPGTSWGSLIRKTPNWKEKWKLWVLLRVRDLKVS